MPLRSTALVRFLATSASVPPTYRLRFARPIHTVRGGQDFHNFNNKNVHTTSTSQNNAPHSQDSTPAILFDIDGVFKQGGLWEKDGLSALRRVIEAKVPFAFMTNGGGGKTEAEYAQEIFKKLFKACNADGNEENLDLSPECISAEHMVLSYSPWKVELEHLKDKPVLIVGDPPSKVMNVATEYGFTRPIHIEEYSQSHPLLNPFQRYVNEAYNTSKEKWEEGIQAILVFTDPVDYFESIQICSDLLLSSRPGEVEVEEGHDIPIYFSNPDMLWKAQHKFPRFGQGAFKACLKSLYQVIQYQSALRTLLDQEQDRKISHVYMVGDNTQSDILGAVNMNDFNGISQPTTFQGMSPGRMRPQQVWGGVLVRTGVFKDGDNEFGAIAVCDDVTEAVDCILRNHGLNK